MSTCLYAHYMDHLIENLMKIDEKASSLEPAIPEYPCRQFEWPKQERCYQAETNTISHSMHKDDENEDILYI